MKSQGSGHGNFIEDVSSFQGKAEHPREMLSASQQRFFESLVTDDDMVAVLRGHLYVEADVIDLLEGLFPGSASLIDDLTYEQKIRRLRKAMEIPSDIATLLKALGELRNAFAHTLERQLTKADDDRFFAALSNEFKPGVLFLVQQGAFPDRPGASVRAAILVLHTGLCALRLRKTSK